jgi:hypothetical protein
MLRNTWGLGWPPTLSSWLPCRIGAHASKPFPENPPTSEKRFLHKRTIEPGVSTEGPGRQIRVRVSAHHETQQDESRGRRLKGMGNHRREHHPPKEYSWSLHPGRQPFLTICSLSYSSLQVPSGLRFYGELSRIVYRGHGHGLKRRDLKLHVFPHPLKWNGFAFGEGEGCRGRAAGGYFHSHRGADFEGEQSAIPC